MRKKEYTLIIQHNYKEKTKESEQKMQSLADYITRELLIEYPHLLDEKQNENEEGE